MIDNKNQNNYNLYSVITLIKFKGAFYETKSNKNNSKIFDRQHRN